MGDFDDAGTASPSCASAGVIRTCATNRSRPNGEAVVATSLREKLIKIGAKVVNHGCCVTFLMAEVTDVRRNPLVDLPVAGISRAGLSGAGGGSDRPRKERCVWMQAKAKPPSAPPRSTAQLTLPKTLEAVSSAPQRTRIGEWFEASMPRLSGTFCVLDGAYGTVSIRVWTWDTFLNTKRGTMPCGTKIPCFTMC